MKTLSMALSSSFYTLVNAGVFITCLSGCGTKSLERDLRKEQRNLKAIQHRALDNDYVAINLNWGQAQKKLLVDNTGLKRERIRLKEVERQQKERWKEWLPNFSGSVNIGTSIRDLSSLTRDDVVASLVAPLRIPNPLTEKARTLELALQRVQAEDAYELSRRQTLQRLYQLFGNYREFSEFRNRALKSKKKDIRSQILEKLRSSEKELTKARRLSSLEQQASQLLGLPFSSIWLDHQTQPPLDYSSRIDQLRIGENYGRLALRLASYEIEAAVLRSKGLKISQWPSLSLGSSLPPLVNTQTDDNFNFSSERVFLFSGLTHTFDLTGRESRNIKTANQNIKFVRLQLNNRLDVEIRRWKLLKREYQELLRAKDLISSKMDRLKNKSLENVATAQFDFEALQTLEIELEGLKAIKLRLDFEIWLWDDDAWN